MNATDIKQAIAEHRREVAQLEKRKALFEAARQEALAAPPSRFNQRDVDEAAAAVARVDRQLANTRERIAALKRQLPSDKALREANAEAARLAEEIENARVQHEAAWREFVLVSEQAENAARRTADAYGASRSAVARLTDLAREFGLSVAIPDVTSMPPQYGHVVGLTGSLISNVGYSGEIGETVERGLNAAKRALPAES